MDIGVWGASGVTSGKTCTHSVVYLAPDRYHVKTDITAVHLVGLDVVNGVPPSPSSPPRQ
jgi:hypothetical protein